jgi:prolyl-tRNA synthetase
MKALYLDREGRQQPFEMGCYGIGVTRIVGAAIEQNNDAKGIVWPMPMAPFQLAIVPVGYHKNAAVREAADRLYEQCRAADIDALLDDRDERPGVMFADMELVGIPCRVVVGERGLRDGRIEFQGRRDAEAQSVAIAEALPFIQERLCAGS